MVFENIGEIVQDDEEAQPAEAEQPDGEKKPKDEVDKLMDAYD